MFHLIPVVGLH
jgi:hypothetical protein